MILFPFKTGSFINNKDSIILNPLSPNRCAYLFQCSKTSVSLKGSSGKCSTGLTVNLLDSNNSFLARILAIDNEETFGSFSTEKLILGIGIGVISFGISGFCSKNVLGSSMVIEVTSGIFETILIDSVIE